MIAILHLTVLMSSCFFTQAHSAVERAALLSAVKIKKIPGDADAQMRGAELIAKIEDDR